MEIAHQKRKRLHVHALPLIAAVLGVTGFLALSVQASRGDITSMSVLRPALGAGSWLADTGVVRASLYDAPVVKVSAGAQVYLDDLKDPDASESADGRSTSNVDMDAVTKAIALQMALNNSSPTKRR